MVKDFFFFFFFLLSVVRLNVSQNQVRNMEPGLKMSLSVLQNSHGIRRREDE